MSNQSLLATLIVLFIFLIMLFFPFKRKKKKVVVNKKIPEEKQKPFTKEDVKKILVSKSLKPIKFGSGLSPYYYFLWYLSKTNHSHKRTNKRI